MTQVFKYSADPLFPFLLMKEEYYIRHCEIFGSYLQQPHQHHVSKAHFYAEPHSQAEANAQQGMIYHISKSKLTDSLLSDNPSMTSSSLQTDVGGDRLVLFSGLICFGNIPWFFFAFGEITVCGSASLKLYVCDAAYPWS